MPVLQDQPIHCLKAPTHQVQLATCQHHEQATSAYHARNMQAKMIEDRLRPAPAAVAVPVVVALALVAKLVDTQLVPSWQSAIEDMQQHLLVLV